MRLVTYQAPGSTPRIGALVDDDRRIADLQHGHRLETGRETPALVSMIALMEAGPAGLDIAGAASASAQARGGEALVERSDVALLAPVPRPTQMRDFLCFELHLRQARETRYRRLAADTEDPEAAFEAYRVNGALDPPQVWYDQPIYYTTNSLAVIGSEQDVIWPWFAEKMDFELEFGVFIGRSGADIPRAEARSPACSPA